MRFKRRSLVAAPVLMVILAATGVAAGDISHTREPLPRFGTPVILVLHGVIQQTREAARGTSGSTVASLGFADGKPPGRRWLAVSQAHTLDDDDTLDGEAALNLVDPLDPNLVLSGPDELVDRVREAAPGTVLRLEGVVERSSRVFYLTFVGRRDVTGV